VVVPAEEGAESDFLQQLLAMGQWMALERVLPGGAGIVEWQRYGLERLLMQLPESDRASWLEQSGRVVNWEQMAIEDAELLRTLNVFWQARGNMSEAAKRLYVHRNTLQYRLDKIKNELGFDPRVQEEAVLLRVGLILYAMNKEARK
jgi:sugar diacid utilization regulator